MVIRRFRECGAAEEQGNRSRGRGAGEEQGSRGAEQSRPGGGKFLRIMLLL